MCTTSIVRFRFSIKDNLTTNQTLNINNKTIETIETIETESKYISNLENIRSIRSTIGLKSNNKLITETLNMNKGLSNGHQLNDNIIETNFSNNLDINSISSTTSGITTTTSSSSTTSTTLVSSCEATMGLSNASTKESLTQHLLLTSLKSGKPENGQRIDLTNISWNELTNKQNNCNKTNDLFINQTNSDTNEHQLQTNCLPQNSPLNDQSVDQMIEEVLNKSESQVSEELTAQPILETNTPEEQQQSHSTTAPEMNDGLNKREVSDCSGAVSEDRTCLEPSPVIDVKEQQLCLIKQTDRLMRRLRRLQFTQNHKHFTKQMKIFVENQQKVLGVGCQRQAQPIPSSVPQLQSFSNPVEDRMKLLTPEGVKGLSTSALVNLVKRLGSTSSPTEANHLHDYYPQTSQQVRVHPQPPPFTSSPHPFIASPQVTQIPSTPTSQLPNCGEESSLVKLLEKSHSQSTQLSTVPQQSRITLEENDTIVSTIDNLSANLRHFENGFDSDATESSSGGESCDEFQDYDQESVPQHSTPIQTSGHTFTIRKRSCWKWCVERAAIASRWTWLQAQVADLEFRIRQQNEMYRQLRATKGLISFGTADHNLTVPNPNAPKGNPQPNVGVISTTNVSNSCLHSTQATVTPKDGLTPIGAQPPHESESHNCMRTLPLNSMRKRKLVRSMSALSGATRKAAKYSTVQCSCNGLPDIVWPCVLCNGRYSYVHVIDTDCMPLFERVALLDSSCHSVLSLNNDVSLGLHFTELLKRETIQRPIPSRLSNKKRKSPPSPTLSNKFIFDSSKNKSPKRSQSVISSTKLKKKYDGSKRRYVRRSGVPGETVWRKRGRPRERASSGSSRTESPIPSPVPSEGSSCGNSLSAPLHRRRRSEQHAFDINNIVIPYSIAATTRVEKLQYKEIITPKWRVVDSFEEQFNFSQLNIKSEIKIEPKPEITPKEEPIHSDEEDEDITETAFAIRHAKCEEEERKRILSFMKGDKTSGSMRGRGARVRFDSTRSDTNASTADGVFQNTDSTSQDSYTGPSTPVAPNCIDTTVVETPSPVTERRRNASLSSRRDDSIDEYFESVAPFDLRVFPLNDLEFDLLSKDTIGLIPIEDNLESINDPEKSNEGTITANNSRAPTPVDSDGAESVVEPTDEVDNDEDPEWEPKKL